MLSETSQKLRTIRFYSSVRYKTETCGHRSSVVLSRGKGVGGVMEDGLTLMVGTQCGVHTLRRGGVQE